MRSGPGQLRDKVCVHLLTGYDWAKLDEGAVVVRCKRPDNPSVINHDEFRKVSKEAS